MTFEHLADVLDEVKPLGQLFADAGYRLFLVGGIVRDQWLDESLDSSSDIDLTTNALPAEIKRIVAPFAVDLWTQGEKFGTIGLRANGRDYEITTHRAESYSSDSRKPVVSFGDQIDVDLSRRDFTVNAMAIELPDGDLVDPYGGAKDLPAKLLRTPLSADVSFTDDPLRMLRAARFATKFSLVPDDELVTSATQLHRRIRIVAIERIGVELRRLLGLKRPRVGLDFLADTGLLAEVLSYGKPDLIDHVQPRLAAAIETVDQLSADWRLGGPIANEPSAALSRGPAAPERGEQARQLRPEDLWARTSSTVSWHMRLAAIGIRVFDDVAGVRAMCERLRLSNDNQRQIVRLSRAALQVVQDPNTADESIRRWLDATEDPPDALTLAATLAPDASRVADFEQAVQALTGREQGQSMDYLDGDAIMTMLGVAPGPVIGTAQKYLRDCYFATGPLTTAQQEELLTSWWADQPQTRE